MKLYMYGATLRRVGTTERVPFGNQARRALAAILSGGFLRLIMVAIHLPLSESQRLAEAIMT